MLFSLRYWKGKKLYLSVKATKREKEYGLSMTLSGFHLAFQLVKRRVFLSGKQLLGPPKNMTTVAEKAIVVFLQVLWNELKVEADVRSSRAFTAC